MPDQDRYSSQERLIIVTVGLIAVAAMVFGFLGIKKTISLPFGQQGEGSYRTPEERQEEAMAILRETDTDHDGLSDYDEHYVFQTNPYLEDTDSDGIPDGREISENTDPNCPKGSACAVPRVSPSEEEDGGSGSAGELDDQTLVFIQTFGNPQELTREQAEAKVQAMSDGEMRTFFVRMGVPEEAVSQADGPALRQLAIEALKEITFVNDLTTGSEE